MGCRARCSPAPGQVNAQATDCINLIGDGSAPSPLEAEPIIPVGAVVPHPAAPGVLPDTINGITCSPTGLMVPQPGFLNLATFDLPIGSLPPIVADTPGTVPWGPIVAVSLANLNTDRLMAGFYSVVHPSLSMVLEPGAVGEYGVILDPLGLAVFLPLWTVTNTGTATGTWDLLPQTALNLFSGLAIAPSGTFTTDVQSYVGLTGSAGGSSIVSVVFGSGLGWRALGVPV